MKAEMTGTIKSIGDVQTFASGFIKQEAVIEEENGESKYPNVLPFTFKKTKIELLKDLAAGAKVKIVFTIDGNQWQNPKTGRSQTFVSLNVLKLEVLSAAPASSAPGASIAAGVDGGHSDDSDLPF
jgi:hypothetical protein